jgi:hypothetical protein
MDQQISIPELMQIIGEQQVNLILASRTILNLRRELAEIKQKEEMVKKRKEKNA